MASTAIESQGTLLFTVGLRGSDLELYDRAGRLVSWQPPTGSAVAYEWDASGNRTRAGSATFTYDERNQLTSGPDGTYAWTSRGTLASVAGTGGTTAYAADGLGRMIGIGATTLTYDSLDRVATAGAGTFTYAGKEIDPASDPTGLSARGPDGQLIAARARAVTRFVASDRHGDVDATFDPTGALGSSTVFDPFGSVVATAGTPVSAAGFQGDYTDPTSGQVWMGARWYRPGDGGFDSRDAFPGSWSDPASLNRYGYAQSDPLGNTDPTGQCALDARLVGCVVNAIGSFIGKVGSAFVSAGATILRFGEALGSQALRLAVSGVKLAASGLGSLGSGIVNAAKSCWNNGYCRGAIVVAASAAFCVATAGGGCLAAMAGGAAIGGVANLALCGMTVACAVKGALAGAAAGGFGQGIGSLAGVSGLATLSARTSRIAIGFAEGIGAEGTLQAIDGRLDLRRLAIAGGAGAALRVGIGELPRLRQAATETVGDWVSRAQARGALTGETGSVRWPGSSAATEGAPTIVNLGGDGEVAGAINVQPARIGGSVDSALENAQRVAAESRQPVVMAEGNNLPFRTGSVDQVWTNNVPVGKGGGYFGPNFDPAEIFRILREGGSWLGNSAP